MSLFNDTQARLNALIPLPSNLPVVYLLGDTGAGKTCFVRQLLGTTNQNFPSVKRVRTTVAPTDFIITNECELKAAFIFKGEQEIARCVIEILEEAILSGLRSFEDKDTNADLTDILGDSPDQRFRLRCFLNEKAREAISNQITTDLVPRVSAWINSNFPNEDDRSTAAALALEVAFSSDMQSIRDDIVASINAQIRKVCSIPDSQAIPESYSFSSEDKRDFVDKLKSFLSVDEGSISPVVEKARVRGMLRSSLLPENVELVIIDGEGIGHDVRESRVLSARHLEYFYISDCVVLVEDSEAPFKAGGKSALAAIVKNGYLPKLCLAFSRLDKVQAEPDERSSQKREVEKSLRNALHALKDEGINLERKDLDVRYFAHMSEMQPDQDTQSELSSLVGQTLRKHGEAKARFVVPQYDFELLAGFLTEATTGLRRAWQGHISGDGAPAAPWQTQKAFTFRMSWKRDEYKYLKPVAEFSDLLVSKLEAFVSKPLGWAEEITGLHKKQCLQFLTQQISRRVLDYVRIELLDDEHSQWENAASLSGTGSTFVRRRLILDIIRASAPELTGEHAKQFKDDLKGIIESALKACAKQPE